MGDDLREGVGASDQAGAASAVSVRARRRVPAAERREELIGAAVHEFARGGLHGTAVERIARRVGVAQPYVFSLFANKRELFLAALERSFQEVADAFRRAAAEFREGRAPTGCEDALDAMGHAYKALLLNDRDYLMLQHQCYAACDDELVRARVRHRYAELVELARELSGAAPERLDDFFRHGMALNVAAALGVEELSVSCDWVAAELRPAV
jgi:AcrR family transcriptional regulator